MPGPVPSLAAFLGLPPDAKILVPHQDDVGMCHGANQAFRDLAGRGFITAGSVMVPCPWFRELADMATADPALDIGVHLTLTSEWRHYRWRPLTGVAPENGLVDQQGFMWPRAEDVRMHARPEAVEAELRAQIETALAAGIDATHLDAHMGTALAPEFADIYIRLGRDYDLPILFTRRFGDYGCITTFGYVDGTPHETRAQALEAAGLPLFDHFAESPWLKPGRDEEALEALIDGLQQGLTFYAFHPNASGDIEVIDPERAHCRTIEHRLFQDPAFLGRVERAGAQLIGFRIIRDYWRQRGRQ